MNRSYRSLTIAVVMLLVGALHVSAQQRGVESISATELKTHLEFIASDELAGRNTPSPELKITSRYLATMVESYGFKPLMPDGSFLQNIPLEVTSNSETGTRMVVRAGGEEQVFTFPQDFGLGRGAPTASYSGGIVLVGYGVEAPDLGWDDYGDLDLTGMVVVILEGGLPEGHALTLRENRRVVFRRSTAARMRRAQVVINVIGNEREKHLTESGSSFNNAGRARLIESGDPGQQSGQSSQQLPFVQVDMRQAAAAALLGISREELDGMFAKLGRGEQVPVREFPGRNVDLNVERVTQTGYTSNVVAVLEGSDPVLRNEYILYGSHHDHLGVSERGVFNGADDNGSGTVAMLELAQAFALERPKRSVIMVWHTGEEKGLWGARQFVRNSPVPVEKMSAELNLDMICRNDPDSLFLIGSDKLSTELDAAINEVNDRHIHLNFDYVYNDTEHPDRFFFRSDHLPYIEYGIPAVWFFCGTTEDYHQVTDTIDRVDFGKMERVTRLVYLVGYEIGNMDEMLTLDAHPEIKTRGAHNLEIRWR